MNRGSIEERGAQEELRRSEERFELLVRSVKDYAILMLDPEGRVVSWNEGAERIKGYRANEILGKSFTTFYPKEAVDSSFPQLELDAASREGRFEDEGWRVRKDGSRFWANVIITALRSPDGQLVGFAKVTRDLTARREAEAQARRLAVEQACRFRKLRPFDSPSEANQNMIAV
jgi:PAS domain S-box-containing protein